MSLRFCIRGAALALLLAATPQPAAAQLEHIALSNQQLVAALDRAAVADEGCYRGPYTLYRQTCVSSELNISPERPDYQQLTVLDRMALFVYRYKDLNLRQELTSGAKVFFKAGLANVYDQEAYVELRLRLRF